MLVRCSLFVLDRYIASCDCLFLSCRRVRVSFVCGVCVCVRSPSWLKPTHSQVLVAFYLFAFLFVSMFYLFVFYVFLFYLFLFLFVSMF